ncbi:MAG: hypothetical protein KF750_00535 [Xanthobacteraceae bacterium]|nr:hypothetical protein [Xanthobacteraceae bacterium]
MHIRHFLVAGFGFWLCTSVVAQQHAGVLDPEKLWNSENPAAYALRALSGSCSLVVPMQPEIDDKGIPTSAARGALINAKDPRASIINLEDPDRFPFCRPDKFRPISPLDLKQKAFPVPFGVVLTKDAGLGIKLKAAKILNVLDINLKDIEVLRIRFEFGASKFLDSRELFAAGADAQTCPNAYIGNRPNPENYFVRGLCVGHIAIGMNATKGATLSAFELAFKGFTVGINGKWVKQLNGDLTDCTPEKQAALKKEVKENQDKVAQQNAASPKSDSPAAAPTRSQKAAKIIRDVTPIVTGLLENKGNTVQAQKSDTQPKKDDTPQAQKECVKDILYKTEEPVVIGVILERKSNQFFPPKK